MKRPCTRQSRTSWDQSLDGEEGRDREVAIHDDSLGEEGAWET
jgi:hypothetical protein